jgi:hypothetical protein
MYEGYYKLSLGRDYSRVFDLDTWQDEIEGANLISQDYRI